ncbi:hypothetical protein ILYODFUR_013001 [Ilyodon furcidens]|uniref:Uncharacterized protein n=1 Tax=Ilyodon furcidens TaxID=33524 RepID=A0ABV0UG48_9TELE
MGERRGTAWTGRHSIAGQKELTPKSDEVFQQILRNTDGGHSEVTRGCTELQLDAHPFSHPDAYHGYALKPSDAGSEGSWAGAPIEPSWLH